jgi:hypothetical protein
MERLRKESNDDEVVIAPKLELPATAGLLPM